MASKNHILLVFENFNIDQHGLLKEDINVKDKKKNHYYILCLFAKGKNKKSEGFAKQKQPAIFVMWHASQLVVHQPSLIYNVP